MIGRYLVSATQAVFNWMQNQLDIPVTCVFASEATGLTLTLPRDDKGELIITGYGYDHQIAKYGDVKIIDWDWGVSQPPDRYCDLQVEVMAETGLDKQEQGGSVSQE